MGASATSPKLDDQACTELRLEHLKSVELGLYADIQRGPEWAKANLAPERLRDLELFIQLDEQVKFGCRDAKLTLDAERAGEAAKRLELNPDLDPAAPAGSGVINEETGEVEGGPDALPPAAAPDDVKPKPKRKAERPAKPAQKAETAAQPKPADAFTPAPGTETTLQAPPAAATPLTP